MGRPSSFHCVRERSQIKPVVAGIDPVSEIVCARRAFPSGKRTGNIILIP